MHKSERYIDGVLSGKIIAGQWIKKICARHKKELTLQKKRDFKFFFDQEIAERVIEAFELQRLALGDKTDMPFILMDWQAAILWMAYGWRRKDTKRRRFVKVYIKVARGNAKTEFLAGVGNIGFLVENEKDPQIYWVATKKQQAKIGFDRQKTMIERMCRDYTEVADMCSTSMHRIYENTGVGYVTYLGKDSKTEDGFSPLYGLVDEYHAHPNDSMIHVVESGMIKRQSPMTWIITTAGNNPVCPCKQFEDRAKKVLDGDIDNDQLLPFIYDLDPEDDWNDENVWPKANPGLGITVDIPSLRSEYQKAITEGVSKENNFKTKNLNIWVSSAKAWIKDADFKRSGNPFEKSDLAGRLCFGGLDLSKSRDITALALFFPDVDGPGKHRCLMHFWCPEENAIERTRIDAVPYMQWARDGYMTLTPGDIIDYDYIKTVVMSLRNEYNFHSSAFDRWRQAEIVTDIVEEIGPTDTESKQFMEGFAQTPSAFNNPCVEMEKMILGRELNHGNNPVLEWMNRNVVIVADSNGNIKIDKAKSKEKVDGMVALAMAIGQYLRYKHKISESTVDIIII